MVGHMKNNRKILLTHSDLDGFFCYFVIKFFNIEFDAYEICDYDQFDLEDNFKKLEDYDEIYMTDYSVSDIIVKKLLNLNKKIITIDHHSNDNSKLLQQIKDDNFIFYFNNEKAGCMLTYEFFKPKSVRVKKIFFDALTLANTYDLFKTQDPLWEQAQNMNRVLYGCLSYGQTGIEKFDWIKDYWLNKVNRQNEWSWSDFEQKKIDAAIASETKEYNSAMSTYREYTDSKSKKYGIAVADKKISIVALRILNEKPNIEYLIMINNYTKKWDKISVRSHIGGTFSCNDLKECKGHDCAAGGEVEPKFAMDLYRGLKQLSYKDDKI